MQNTSNRIKQRKKLKYGDINKIAELSGVSRSTVERYFEGENNNEEIEAIVTTLLSERELKRKERIEQAKKIA